jgi:hypothetical protein
LAAGLAALILAKNDSLTASEVKQVIRYYNEIDTKVGADHGGSEPAALVAGTFHYNVGIPETTFLPWPSFA